MRQMIGIRASGRGPVGRKGRAGFNLVEVMVVLVVLGILMAVGVPSLRFVLNSGRVSNPSNELLATLQLARMEAIRSGSRTVVCRSDNADATTPTCTTTAGNWGGWIAYRDTDGDAVLDAGEPILRVTAMNPPATVFASAPISGASSRVVFRPDGLARTNAGALLSAVVRICVPATVPQENARDVTITNGSRFTVVRATAAVAAGACATP